MSNLVVEIFQEGDWTVENCSWHVCVDVVGRGCMRWRTGSN